MNLRDLIDTAVGASGDDTGFAVFDGNIISFGMESSRGRPLAVFVRDQGRGVYRLSDGGEAWSGLASAGYADPAPTNAEVARLERLCEMYALKWDTTAREVYGDCEPREILDVGRRITSVSLAIDGWKAFFPPVERQLQRVTDVVRRLVEVAPASGWVVESQVTLRGNVHTWRMPALLSRPHHAVAVDFSLERDPEHILRDAAAWQLDRRDQPRVFVVRDSVLVRLRESSELGKLIRLVGRATQGTEQRVVAAAHQLIAAA